MSFDLASVRAGFLSDALQYARLCEWAEHRLQDRLRRTSVYCPSVTARPKALRSFLRKAVRDSLDDPLHQIRDRAGVRVIVIFKRDVAEVERVVAELFDFDPIDRKDKSQELDPDQLGYLGIHYFARGRAEDLGAENADLLGFEFEIQIHTAAESAWAAASHRITYKPVGSSPSDSVKRRVNRLVALVELFDQEVETSWSEIVETPGYEQGAMLAPLEEMYLTLIDDPEFDEALSLIVLGVIRDAYTSEELARFTQLMTDFVESHREFILAQWGSTTPEDSHPLLFQPETLAILERLERREGAFAGPVGCSPGPAPSRHPLRATWAPGVIAYLASDVRR